METSVIKKALDQAEKHGAKLEDCFWLASRYFVEKWKSDQKRTEQVTISGETASMGGVPVQITEFLSTNACLLDQDLRVFAKLDAGK